MKALLIKDYYSIGKYYWALIIVPLICVLLLSINRNENYYTYQYAVLGFSMIAYFLCYRSKGKYTVDNNRWSEYEGTFPISRRDVVNARFLPGFIYSIFIIVVAIAILYFDDCFEFYNARYDFDYLIESMDQLSSDDFLGLGFYTASAIIIVSVIDILENSLVFRIPIEIFCLLIWFIVIQLTYVFMSAIWPAGSEFGDIWFTLRLGILQWLVTLFSGYILCRIQIKRREYI